MNRLHDMPPGVIEDLDEEYLVGVLGLDAGGWGYITMGPDIDLDSIPNDGWGFLLPQCYYYVPPTATTSATTSLITILIHNTRHPPKIRVPCETGLAS